MGIRENIYHEFNYSFYDMADEIEKLRDKIEDLETEIEDKDKIISDLEEKRDPAL